jgi:hypothetical protein
MGKCEETFMQSHVFNVKPSPAPIKWQALYRGSAIQDMDIVAALQVIKWSLLT